MSAVVLFIYYLIQVMAWAIFIRVILSWFVMTSRSGFLVSVYQVLVQVTEPILAPLRRIIPMIGMFDITPIVAFIALQIIGEVLIRALA
jgi:YggT family protein